MARRFFTRASGASSLLAEIYCFLGLSTLLSTIFRPSANTSAGVEHGFVAASSFTDANEHEYCRPLLWPESRVALVYKADRASGIERVGVENLLVLLATRAAGRLFTGSCDNPDRWSVGAGSETKESGGTGRAHRS